jgi:hypothetical protein
MTAAQAQHQPHHRQQREQHCVVAVQGTSSVQQQQQQQQRQSQVTVRGCVTICCLGRQLPCLLLPCPLQDSLPWLLLLLLLLGEVAAVKVTCCCGPCTPAAAAAEAPASAAAAAAAAAAALHVLHSQLLPMPQLLQPLLQLISLAGDQHCHAWPAANTGRMHYLL